MSWRRHRREARLALGAATAAVVLLSGPGTPAGAQDRPLASLERGIDLAGRLCSTCHLMEGASQAAVPAGILTLRGIANRPGQTGQRILDTLIQPHPPMPDIRLSIEEINSLILYIESLRTNQATPPLITPEKGRIKPAYPQPS